MKEEVLKGFGRLAGKLIAAVISLVVLAALIYLAVCGILSWVRGEAFLDSVRYLWGLIVKR